MNNLFGFDERLLELSEKALKMCEESFNKINKIQEYNQQKMLKAFQEAGVSESHFAGSTGYGYDDRGRDILDKVYAYVFDAEDALVRHNFVSGTHALTVALFGLLRPNDTMLCVTGRPYDTLLGVLGINGESSGSLREFGIGYDEVALLPDGTVNLAGIEEKLKAGTYKIVYIHSFSTSSALGSYPWCCKSFCTYRMVLGCLSNSNC